MAAAAAMLLLLSGCSSARKDAVAKISAKYRVPREKQLIVYTSHKEEVYLPIIREFENRTGIWVEIHAGEPRKCLRRLETPRLRVPAT